MSIENKNQKTIKDINNEPEYIKIQELGLAINKNKQASRLIRETETLIEILICQKEYKPTEITKVFDITPAAFISIMNKLNLDWWKTWWKKEKVRAKIDKQTNRPEFEKIISNRSKIEPIIDKIRTFREKCSQLNIEKYIYENIAILQPYVEKYGIYAIEKIIGVQTSLRKIVLKSGIDLSQQKYNQNNNIYKEIEKELIKKEEIQKIIKEIKNIKQEKEIILKKQKALIQQLIDDGYNLFSISKFFKIHFYPYPKKEISSATKEGNKIISLPTPEKKLASSREQAIMENEELINIISSYTNVENMDWINVKWIQNTINTRQRLWKLYQDKIKNWSEKDKTTLKKLISKYIPQGNSSITNIAVTIWDTMKEIVKTKNNEDIKLKNLDINEIDNLRWEALIIWLKNKMKK